MEIISQEQNKPTKLTIFPIAVKIPDVPDTIFICHNDMIEWDASYRTGYNKTLRKQHYKLDILNAKLYKNKIEIEPCKVKGYSSIKIDNKKFDIHRLIYKLGYLGYDPERPTVDHINRDRVDFRLSNLRLANMHEQVENSSKVIDRTDYGIRSVEDPKLYRHNYDIAHADELRQYREEHKEARKEQHKRSNEKIKAEREAQGLFRTRRMVDGKLVDMLVPISEKKLVRGCHAGMIKTKRKVNGKYVNMWVPESERKNASHKV